MRPITSFFDFVFYRTYSFYQRNGEREISGVYALSVITLFPLLNLSSFIFILIDLLKVRVWNYSKPLLLVCFLLVMTLNYYRIYRHIGLNKFMRTWNEADEGRKKRLGTGMMIYLIASFVILFASIIY